MAEVYIYVEGGGNDKDGRGKLRRGFEEFLKSASRPGSRPCIVACGSRQKTYETFKIGLARHPNAFNVLLVDSEDAVKKKPWKHLKDRDGWSDQGCSDDRCHLMAQTMEAWIVADADALQGFYGNGFKRSALPTTQDIESVAKKTVADSIKSATKDTKTKGKYHKLRHGPKLLGLLDPGIVRPRARHCDRLFSTLESVMA